MMPHPQTRTVTKLFFERCKDVTVDESSMMPAPEFCQIKFVDVKGRKIRARNTLIINPLRLTQHERTVKTPQKDPIFISYCSNCLWVLLNWVKYLWVCLN
ncbi:hypothetical protein Hanom_Chr10g00955761 [Helianthus anomalus]